MQRCFEYKGFFGTAHFSGQDRVFFGQLTGIDDLVSYEAFSIGELRTNFRIAVNDYLDTLQQLGKNANV